jgi:hypothetical protein
MINNAVDPLSGLLFREPIAWWTWHCIPLRASKVVRAVRLEDLGHGSHRRDGGE